MSEKSKTKEPESKMRQIIIETDGKEITIVKAEVSQIEFVAICQMIHNRLTTPTV